MKLLTRVTQPTLEPVEVEDLEVWAGAAITAADGTVDTDDSTILSDLITQQRSWLEIELGRATVNSTWTLALDEEDVADAGSVLWLPMPPLVSVSSIVTYDSDDTESTLATTVYQVIAGDPGRVVLRSGQSWPTALRDYACMVISFTAGYGDDPDDCEPALRTAVKSLVTFYYRHRGTGLYEGAGGWKGETPDEVARILRRLVIYDARPKVG